jgi:transposase-like protein
MRLAIQVSSPTTPTTPTREGTAVQHEPPPRWTPEAQAQLIILWEQGLATTDIAKRLGMTPTTVRRRARDLQRRGLIQPRLRRHTSPRQQVLAQIMAFLMKWADEPDINEVFIGQLRHLAIDAHRSQRTALEHARRRHERN